jgi:hypothetical protein
MNAKLDFCLAIESLLREKHLICSTTMSNDFYHFRYPFYCLETDPSAIFRICVSDEVITLSSDTLPFCNFASKSIEGLSEEIDSVLSLYSLFQS